MSTCNERRALSFLCYLLTHMLLQMYKEEYGKRKKVRRVRHWDFPPVLPFMGPSIPDYPPTHPCLPPGFMIGGDYDLRPNVAPGLQHLLLI